MHTDIKITSFNALQDEHYQSLAHLIEAANPQYYSLLPFSPTQRTESIVQFLRQESCPLPEFTRLIYKGTYLAGAAIAYPSNLQAQVQMSEVKAFLQNLSSSERQIYISKLQSFANATVNELPQNTYYLFRIAVLESFRGQGLAKMLIEDYLDIGKYSQGYCLHVKKDNFAAITLYEKNEFKPISTYDETKDYILMLKSCQ
jgi:ribosomal protein S18 acetylase RimI-like enzyme